MPFASKCVRVVFPAVFGITLALLNACREQQANEHKPTTNSTASSPVKSGLSLGPGTGSCDFDSIVAYETTTRTYTVYKLTSSCEVSRMRFSLTTSAPGEGFSGSEAGSLVNLVNMPATHVLAASDAVPDTAVRPGTLTLFLFGNSGAGATDWSLLGPLNVPVLYVSDDGSGIPVSAYEESDPFVDLSNGLCQVCSGGSCPSTPTPAGPLTPATAPSGPPSTPSVPTAPSPAPSVGAPTLP